MHKLIPYITKYQLEFSYSLTQIQETDRPAVNDTHTPQHHVTIDKQNSRHSTSTKNPHKKFTSRIPIFLGNKTRTGLAKDKRSRQTTNSKTKNTVLAKIMTSLVSRTSKTPDTVVKIQQSPCDSSVRPQLLHNCPDESNNECLYVNSTPTELIEKPRMDLHDLDLKSECELSVLNGETNDGPFVSDKRVDINESIEPLLSSPLNEEWSENVDTLNRSMNENVKNTKTFLQNPEDIEKFWDYRGPSRSGPSGLSPNKKTDRVTGKINSIDCTYEEFEELLTTEKPSRYLHSSPSSSFDLTSVSSLILQEVKAA